MPSSSSGRASSTAACSTSSSVVASRRSTSLSWVMRATSSRSSISRTSRRELALHHVLQRIVAPAHLQAPDRQRVAQRRQRVAQFVREGGEELVLALVGLAQQLFGLGALADLGLQFGVARGQRVVGDPQRFVERFELARLLDLQRLVGRAARLVLSRLQFAALAVQLGQHLDLAAQDLRDHRHHHVVDRAQLVAAQPVHVGRR